MLSHSNVIIYIFLVLSLPHVCISRASLLRLIVTQIHFKIYVDNTLTARVILDCDCYTPSSELSKELNCQTFPERVTYQKAILMYIIINNICIDYSKNYVSYTSDISCRDTIFTNCNQLYTPTPNCELFRKSFMYSGAAIWNSLPLHVKNATSADTFKCLYLKWKRLNDHLIISNTTANLILYFVMI